MKSVVAGGSGFIGSALVERLLARGEVVVLSRDPSGVERGRGVAWHPPAAGEWTREVEDADVIVNLAGENIGASRWTESRKRALVSSRVEPTRAIVDALLAASPRERILLNASAVGIYGDRGDEVLEENAGAGEGFLSELGTAWEGQAQRASSVARVITPRFGVVIARGGGMLEKMVLPFKLGGGAKLGSGEQWMSWISLGDAIDLMMWLIDQPDASGAYNATSPEPVTNTEFTRALGKALHRPAFLRAPALPLRLALGEMADSLLLASQRAVPARAQKAGFEFRHANIGQALAAALTRSA